MSKSIYIRATKRIKDAGIDNIVVNKGLWGAWPCDIRAKRQSSRSFPTWQQAAAAVIEDGYRPLVAEFKEGYNSDGSVAD